MNRVLSTIRAQFCRVIRTVLPGRRVESDFSAFNDYIRNNNLLCVYDNPAIGFQSGHLGRFKLSVRWLLSIASSDKRDLCEEEGVLHGLWPLHRLLTPKEMQDHHDLLVGDEVEFNKLVKTHEEFILRHWCCMQDPKSIDAAKRFIKREWTKHGKPAGMPLIHYTYHALCLKCTLPNSFGIPVGVEMSLNQAGEGIRSVLRDLQLFGVHIGADVLPEISAVLNPIRGGPFWIDEVRPHFETSVVDGSVTFKVVEVTDPKSGGKKMSHMHYKGSVNDGKNRVMLPSRVRD